jgi:predicted glycoside hydrolase/deacetylase ChbG (UPF0249 family)
MLDRHPVRSSVLAGKQQAAESVVLGQAQSAPRPIWLCADDYGISLSVNRAIRDLVMRGRINATSVMVLAPSFDRSEAASLNMLNAGVRRVAIGLHVTLTAPFRPISGGFPATRSGEFPSLERMFLRGALRTLGRRRLAAEIAAQFEAFVELFGRKPDFIDGHQHVHLFPQVGGALLDVAGDLAPDIWVRQCGRAAASGRADRKGLVLDMLSRRFRARATTRGIRTNPAFAGTYDFMASAAPDFAQLFPGFLEALPAESVVMCHPGFVDAELERLDPLTTLREREYAYFADDAFPALLRAHGVALA